MLYRRAYFNNFKKEMCVYLKYCYGLGNVSYIHAIDLLEEHFSYGYASKDSLKDLSKNSLRLVH